MEEFCKKEGLDFKLLVPLIQETAQRLDTMSPAQAQTGPAIRNDTATIEKHLALLNNNPSLKMLYQALTQSIQQQV
jgi:predicted short-subunit dehydrogenase-like oxidoreductase (DUF2520 family)